MTTAESLPEAVNSPDEGISEQLHDRAQLEVAIEQSRTAQQKLPRELFFAALHQGITDFHGVSIEPGVYRFGEDSVHERRLPHVKGLDLADANLSDSTFEGLDFSDSVLTGASLHNTEFPGSNLNRAIIESIAIGTVSAKLEKKQILDREITVSKDVWHATETQIGICPACEWRNQEVLGLINEIFARRRGIVIFQEGKPLGFVKLTGERSFLAMRTVKSESGEVLFWKGMVYAFDDATIYSLEKLSLPITGTVKNWMRVDVEQLLEYEESVGYKTQSFGRNNMRFVTDPHIFDALTKLVDQIESGEEPTVNIV